MSSTDTVGQDLNEVLTAFQRLRRLLGKIPLKYLIPVAVLYVVSPIDAIPDFIPIVGVVDDIAFVAYTATRIVGALAGALPGRR